LCFVCFAFVHQPAACLAFLHYVDASMPLQASREHHASCYVLETCSCVGSILWCRMACTSPDAACAEPAERASHADDAGERSAALHACAGPRPATLGTPQQRMVYCPPYITGIPPAG
jgi:hypothetical protein